MYTSVEYPGYVATKTQFQLTSQDFKVLDRVSTTGEMKMWFFTTAVGGKAYQALLEEAQKIGGDEKR